MGYVRTWKLSAAIVLFAGAAAAADSVAPQLVGFSISPVSFDSSSGPAVLSVTIRARDDAGGAGIISGGAGIVLTHESGSAVFGRPTLSVISGTSTDLIFQFSITIPQSSLVGVYGITLTLVDASTNSATFDATALQALGFPSTVTITQAISSAVTLGQAATNVPASGGSGSLPVTAQPGAIWSAVSNASWLTITSGSSGTGIGTVIYSAAPNGSSVARTGTITVNSQVFAVTQAAGGSALSAVESTLLFVYPAPSPATKPLTVYSTGAALNFTAAATSPGNWLSVSAAVGVTPAVLNVGVNAAGLPAGTHSGAITLTASGSVNSPQTVSVILIVNSSPDITVAPEQLAFAYQQGGSVPPPQSLLIGGSGAIGFSVAASSAGWLLAGPATGSTPSNVSVSIAPTALAPGSYNGALTITTLDSTSHTVPVTLTVNAPQQIGAISNPLTFAYTIGGALPGVQVLSIPGASGASFSASAASSGNWLKLGASTGTLPAGLGVAVSPTGLAVGVYAGAISLNVQNMAPQSVPVTLVITASSGGPANSTQPPLINPTSLAFSYQSGAANPANQSLSVTGSAGAPFNLTTSGAGWLSVSPLNGTAPATLTASVNPSGLAVGTYTATIFMTSSAGAGGSSQNIGVTLTVTTPVTPPPVTSPPHLTSVVNDASLLSAPLAPGEIISIFGTGLGPDDSQAYDLGASVIGSSLGGTRVIINGKAAPIVLTQAGQVTTIVPYSVAGRTTVQLQVEYQGVQSTAATFAVADAAPAIFTLDRSGRGQAALLNEDTSLNFDLNPADRGAIAVLYASGAGLMTPPSPDGAITGLDLAHPAETVTVLIDGQNAPVLYAGSAPYEVAGVLQVNFRIPPQVRTGAAVGLLLKVGRFTSQPGVTLAIR